MSCPKWTPPAFHPGWCDFTEHLSHYARPVSGLKRTSKVNLWHIWHSHIHHLPLEVTGMVVTTSRNSHLETQEKRHTCHQLSRHKSHRTKQLDPEDKGENGRHPIWRPRAYSPQLWELPAPTKRCPSYIHIKKPVRPQASSQVRFTRLWNDQRAYDFKGWKVPTPIHLGELQECIYRINGFRSAPTHVNWVKFFFFSPFLRLSK